MTIVRRILARAEQAREARRQSRRKEEALNQAIDQVVQASAPVMCSLRDCRRGLRSPVEAALSYLQQTIDAIPGPALLSPGNWDRDPLLKALFVSPEEMSTLLTDDPRLKSYFAQREASRAFALLTPPRKSAPSSARPQRAALCNVTSRRRPWNFTTTGSSTLSRLTPKPGTC